MEKCWEIIPPLPESTWSGERGWWRWKTKQGHKPRAPGHCAVPLCQVRRWVGGGKESFVPAPCHLYPRNGNMLPLDQPILSEPRRPDQRQRKGPPAFLGRPRLLGPPSSLTTGESSLLPFSPRWTPAWSWGSASPAPRRGRAVSLWVDRSAQACQALLFTQPHWSQAVHDNLESLLPRDGLQRLGWVQKDGEDGKRKALSGPNY